MARYRKRPRYCTEPGRCAGGVCGKCVYNAGSNYPMFRYAPKTPEPPVSTLFRVVVFGAMGLVIAGLLLAQVRF
jgi:hypothetical protein